MCPRDFVFVKHQQDPRNALQFLEEEPNRLIARSGRTPAGSGANDETDWRTVIIVR